MVFSGPPLYAGPTACAGTAALNPSRHQSSRVGFSDVPRIPLLPRLEPLNFQERPPVVHLLHQLPCSSWGSSQRVSRSTRVPLRAG